MLVEARRFPASGEAPALGAELGGSFDLGSGKQAVRLGCARESVWALVMRGRACVGVRACLSVRVRVQGCSGQRRLRG